jgi:Protein of unknown function (DUF2909)
MLIKIVIVLLLMLVIFSLFQALFIMVKNDEKGPKMSKFLGRRLLFSAAIVVLLMLLLVTGVVTPNPRPY